MCKYGLGGTWSIGNEKVDPTVWQGLISEDIQNRSYTHTNKHGDIAMSNLEVATEILSFLVLEHITRSLKEAHVGLFCDNTSDVQ